MMQSAIRRNVLALFYLLLFGGCCCIPVASQQEPLDDSNTTPAATAADTDTDNVFSIYTLPPFALTIQFENESSESSQSDNNMISNTDLLKTGAEIQSITQQYLHDYFRASLLNSPSSASLNELHSVELHASLRLLLEDENPLIWAELYGTVAFVEGTGTDTTGTRPSTNDIHELLDSWIANAFDTTTALPVYQQRLVVRNDDNAVLQRIQTIQVTLDVTQGPPSVRGASTATTSNDWSTIEYALLGTLLFFLTSSVVALFLFLKTERYYYRRDAKFDTVQYDTGKENTNGGGGGGADNNQSWDYNMHGGVPQNNNTNADKLVPIMEEGGSRRYVAPNAPDQVLFGASHLHAERTVMENAATAKLSWWQRTAAQLFSHTKQQTTKNQDHPFVYRDFPRHDGTPCLIYNPNRGEAVDNNSIIQEEEDVVVFDTNANTQSIDIGDAIPNDDDNDDDSISSTNSLEVFINRLEHLYQLKQRRYMQRKEMEEERKKSRAARGRRPITTQMPSLLDTASTLSQSRCVDNASTDSATTTTIIQNETMSRSLSHIDNASDTATPTIIPNETMSQSMSHIDNANTDTTTIVPNQTMPHMESNSPPPMISPPYPLDRPQSATTSLGSLDTSTLGSIGRSLETPTIVPEEEEFSWITPQSSMAQPTPITPTNDQSSSFHNNDKPTFELIDETASTTSSVLAVTPEKNIDESSISGTTGCYA